MTSRWTPVAASLVLLAACDAAPGRPDKSSEAVAPNEVVEFRTLYGANCAGCHGEHGRGGAAIGLAEPVYLAIADDASIRKVIAEGVGGTAMPAFAQSAGGMLTDVQVDAITRGIRSWARPVDATPPPRVATLMGDAKRGREAFATYCVSCHGAHGEGGPKGSAITNDSFLALVSDQGLRTVIIAGRPDLGAPDWRGYVPGRPITDQEITDVVAWLSSQRVQTPGRPYAEQTDTAARTASNAARQR
jgi:mono/diheme cytochrome c family protein